MKKTLSIILAIVILALSMTSCSAGENKILEQINTMANQSAPAMEITVDMTDGSNLLSEKYSIASSDDMTLIFYEIERLSSFIINNGVITAPDEYKYTLTGKATIQNGEITVEGDETDLNFSTYVYPTFSFTSDTLSDITIGDGVIAAKVIDQDGFIGGNLGEDMTVYVRFSDVSISVIRINYVSENGYETTITYAFE